METALQQRILPKFGLVLAHGADNFLESVLRGYTGAIENERRSEYQKDTIPLHTIPTLDDLILRNYFFYLEGVLAKELSHPDALADLMCAGPDAWYASRSFLELAQEYSREPYLHYREQFALDVLQAVNYLQLACIVNCRSENQTLAYTEKPFARIVMNSPVVEVW